MAEKRSLTNTAFTATSSSQEALARDGQRQYLLIQNRSTADSLLVAFGATVTDANGILLAPGECYEPPYEVISSVNLMRAVGAAGDVAVVLVTG